MRFNTAATVTILLSKAAFATPSQEGIRGAPLDHQNERKLIVLTQKGELTAASTLAYKVCDFFFDQKDVWTVYLEGGTEYLFTVNRLECEMDPIAWLYDSAGIQVARDDDSLPVLCAIFNYGDPQFTYTPGADGLYTLEVGNFVDPCPADGNYDYEIVIDPPPFSPTDPCKNYPCGNDDKKRAVCSVNSGVKEGNSLCIAPTAVAAHIAQGGFCGECDF